jgi:hypothetical protein
VATATAYVYGNDISLDGPNGNGHDDDKENGLKHGYNNNGKHVTVALATGSRAADPL